MKGWSRRLGMLIVAVLGILVGIWLLSFFYRCPVYWITGIPCPGCGMTRAFFALMHLDFEAAFYWHPAVYLIAASAAVQMAAYVAEGYHFRQTTRLWALVGIVMLVIWMVRLPGYLNGSGPLMVRDGSLGAVLRDLLL